MLENKAFRFRLKPTKMRNLNDFLAEKVMGWRIDGDYLYDGDARLMWACDWNPCGMISHAWQLIDKLDDYVFIVCKPNAPNCSSVMAYKGGARPYGPGEIFFHLKEEEEWVTDPVVKKYGLHPKPVIRVTGKTPSEAICLAAAMVRGWNE